LKQALSARWSVPQNWLTLGNGSNDILELVASALLEPGSSVVYAQHAFVVYRLATQARGARHLVVPAKDFCHDLPAMLEAIDGTTRVVFIANPNNPTGYLYSREELEALKALALKYDLYIFSDEAYREFCYDGKEFISPMHLEGLDQHVIVLDTVSKRYSACGARIGALVTKNKEVIAAALKFAQARLSPPAIGQIAGEAAIDTPASYFEQVNKEYTERRDLLVSELNKMEGVFCPNPGGAFYAVVRLPIDDSDKFCQWMLESFAHENQTVMMAPATGFYSTPGAGKNEVRLAYVLNKTDLAAALTCIAEALKVYPGKTN
jgi:aspartate aminotransferase